MKLFVVLTLFAIVALTTPAAPLWDSCGTKMIDFSQLI